MFFKIIDLALTSQIFFKFVTSKILKLISKQMPTAIAVYLKNDFKLSSENLFEG